MKDPSFLILGCGPVGGIFATFVSGRVGKIGIIDANKSHIQKIREAGLKTILEKDTKTINPFACYASLEDVEDFAYDYLVVALKTPAMEAVIPQAARLIPKDVMVISLQNGIDTEDFLAYHFGPERVFRIVVNYAGTLVEPGTVKLTFFNRPNYLGT